MSSAPWWAARCAALPSLKWKSIPVRVSAYRRNTVRIECGICELRFSMRVDALNNAISRKPESWLNAYASVIYTRHQD